MQLWFGSLAVSEVSNYLECWTMVILELFTYSRREHDSLFIEQTTHEKIITDNIPNAWKVYVTTNDWVNNK